MSTLLDTNVLSELLRAQPHPEVLAWFAEQPADRLFVSAVTQAEMLLGARLLPRSKRRQQLESALDTMFREDFAGACSPLIPRRLPPTRRLSRRAAVPLDRSPSSMPRSQRLR